jgi:hypothetical protein
VMETTIDRCDDLAKTRQPARRQARDQGRLLVRLGAQSTAAP